MPAPETFVATPPLAPGAERTPERLRQLVQKFNPVEPDRRNRTLGKAGEQFVPDVERQRLARGQRPDLARRIRWVAAEEGDGAGYDVLSLDSEGRERLLEMKTTNGSALGVHRFLLKFLSTLSSVSRLLALAATAALFFLYFSGLSSFGLVGPDEPRYASIGHEMATSGDWVTPRLWGAPWFEKPALLYWMIGGAFKLGLGSNLAPRLPVALLSVAFLLAYFLWARREFNPFVGAVSACLLATSAMWFSYSHAAVTDVPLAVPFAGAVMLLLPAVEGRPVQTYWAAVFLALSFLAKGLVPLVLILPFFWFARRYWRTWFRPLAIPVFLAMALPWYIACTWVNGPAFLIKFFWEHQFGRFASDSLQHVQPFWFYLPWLLAAVFPSILLSGFACSRVIYQDRRRRFLLVLVLFGLLFFSASRNKLPGYLLPLLPFVCILVASGLDAARELWPKPLAMTTAASILLIPLFALAGGLLPLALGPGLRNAFPIDLITAGRVADVIPLAIVAAIASLFFTRERALILWFALAFCGWVYIEYAALPWVDRTASARSVWRELPEPKRQFCVGAVSRAWRYGLNYYSVIPLQDCPPDPATLAILPGPSGGSRPSVVSIPR